MKQDDAMDGFMWTTLSKCHIPFLTCCSSFDFPSHLYQNVPTTFISRSWVSQKFKSLKASKPALGRRGRAFPLLFSLFISFHLPEKPWQKKMQKNNALVRRRLDGSFACEACKQVAYKLQRDSDRPWPFEVHQLSQRTLVIIESDRFGATALLVSNVQTHCKKRRALSSLGCCRVCLL